MNKKAQSKKLNLLLGTAAVILLAVILLLTEYRSREEVSSASAEAETTAGQSSSAAAESAAETAQAQQTSDNAFSYVSRIFDTAYVHSVNILLTDWDAFLESAPEEVYFNCSVEIDGERFDNVAVRAKGNTSLKAAVKAENGRYSLKFEFDHYVSGQSYYGLDKLHLNNLSFDATCMKDYLAYYLMRETDVPASCCSYVFVTVNGEDLGLYIALEGIEDSFLERNFGEDYGNFLKPDDKHNQPEAEASAETTAETQNQESTAAQASGQSSWLKEGQVELATLTYVDDDIDSYVVLFNSAKSEFSTKEKKQLISSIKKLNEQKELDEAIDIDEVISYMTVQNFLVNYDGYLGSRIHNYYLYVDRDGRMSMLPWDYNLSFGTYGSGLTASETVNCPLDNPYGTELGSRPMFDWIVESYAYREQYHAQTLELVENYIENGRLEEELDRIHEMIAEYIERDPTKWVTMENYEIGFSELKQIIALRGESLKLQVEGTIPSTLAGQAADPDSLLPVGDLDTSRTSTGFSILKSGTGSEETADAAGETGTAETKGAETE